MRKPHFVKFQLFLLVITVGLIVWRMNSGGPKADGFVSIVDLSVNRLYTKHFVATDTVLVHINALAAFESDRASSGLAVYPWIINLETETVVWKPSEANIVRDGVQAVISDSVTVAPGNYTAYYTTYGPTAKSSEGGSFLGLKPHWTNDPSFWMLSLTSDAPTGIITESKTAAEKQNADNGANLVWSMVPSHLGQSESQMVQVGSASEIQLDLTLAVCGNDCDKVEIYRLPETVPFWQLTEDITEWAGGSMDNRAFSGSVPLTPGVYKIEVSAGSSQSYRSWRSNPPWAPDNWGFRVFTSDPSNVRLLDPWSNGEPLVSMLRVGSDENLSMTLELDQSLSVVVYGMGELGGSDSVYDHGWIEKEGKADYVWEMSYDASTHAGGDSMNRQEMSILNLDPGRYFVRYTSDGSHDHANWNKSQPTLPERWGIAVFAMNPADVTAGSVRVKATERAWSVDTSSAEDGTGLGTALVKQNRLGNEVKVDDLFRLETESKLKIIALGELTGSSSDDYGWITRVSSGEKVWEMTYRNTVAAGGADRNRRFSGTITLGPGEYTVHFETDFSHSYGNFDDDQPDNGQDWGIAVYQTVE